jgi:hypothetical protein
MILYEGVFFKTISSTQVCRFAAAIITTDITDTTNTTTSSSTPDPAQTDFVFLKALVAKICAVAMILSHTNIKVYV